MEHYTMDLGYTSSEDYSYVEQTVDEHHEYEESYPNLSSKIANDLCKCNLGLAALAHHNPTTTVKEILGYELVLRRARKPKSLQWKVQWEAPALSGQYEEFEF